LIFAVEFTTATTVKCTNIFTCEKLTWLCLPVMILSSDKLACSSHQLSLNHLELRECNDAVSNVKTQRLITWPDLLYLAQIHKTKNHPLGDEWLDIGRTGGGCAAPSVRYNIYCIFTIGITCSNDQDTFCFKNCRKTSRRLTMNIYTRHWLVEFDNKN
jgi:hypothetical protein